MLVYEKKLMKEKVFLNAKIWLFRSGCCKATRAWIEGLPEAATGDEAFFFANVRAKNGKGSRRKCIVEGGGYLQGQRMCVDGEKLVIPDGGGGGVGGSGVEVTWRKYVLSYFAGGEKGSSGWVMHEYAITMPTDLASSLMRLYRIRISGHGKKRKREPESQSAHDDNGRAHCAPQIAMAETAMLEDSAPLPQPVHPSCSGGELCL
uniref:NAC domain-containing protein n=1 Tax=Oryza punctata TaxID=4537 RepID=A0A0E0LCX1_ORYPU